MSLPPPGDPGSRPELCVSVLENSHEAPAGRVAHWLAEAGALVRVSRPHAGDAVPTMGDVGDALIVLGGPMDAYADKRAPWLPATRTLLADAAATGLPTLGICLGHQLLAVALGGTVEVGAAAGPERGATVVTWAEEALHDPVLGPAVRAGVAAGHGTRATRDYSWVYEFHSDAVAVPPRGAELLAWSEKYAVQAFRVGSALGVQFHPEVGPEALGRWAATTEGVDEAAAVAIEEEARRVDATVSAVGRGLVRGLVAQARERRADPPSSGR